jgi:hypothetical protein
VWDDELEFKTERAIFLGCYAIRKLKESKLLSHTLCGLNTSFISHPVYTDYVKSESDKWSKEYNFYQSNKVELALENLCNQFIHSKIYSPFLPFGKGCMGFFFASDKEYKKHVYYIQLIKIVNVFLSVVHNKNIKLELDINDAKVSVKKMD